MRRDAAGHPGWSQEGMEAGTGRPVAGRGAGPGTKPECALKSTDRSFKLSQIPYRGLREEGTEEGSSGWAGRASR